jgi:phosphopantetheinyl transferase (holo-ACP synthase)
MVVGLGVDLFAVARIEAEFRKADTVFTRPPFTHDESPSVAHARGAAFASVVLEWSP